MKLTSFKIRQLIITPKMTLSLVGTLFILGMGIGATAASPNNSLFALFSCSLISIFIIAYTFFKK